MQPLILITTNFDVQKNDFAARDAYAEAVTRAGGRPVLARDDSTLADALRTGDVCSAGALAKRADGLILSGGGDIAARLFGQAPHPASEAPDERCDAAEIALCRAFVSADKPVLGICRGMQVLNVALGGTLIQDIPSMLALPPALHGDNTLRHTVDVEAASWLGGLFGERLITNSSHHQCVERLADGFTAAARLGPVIEAMERGHALGVQFHPERMLEEGMMPLFIDFIGRCAYAAVV